VFHVIPLNVTANVRAGSHKNIKSDTRFIYERKEKRMPVNM
jgi:hypothetical protein